MKRSRFSDEQIIGILKEQEAGGGRREAARHAGASDPEDGVQDPPVVAGRPATKRLADTTKGSKKDHSSSVSSPLINADLVV
jgi:hypothetical protein